MAVYPEKSDINLKELLDYGCVDIAFLRGGIMPCLVRGTSIILDVSSNGDYIIRNDIDEKNIPNCMLIDVDNNLPHHMVFDAPVRIISTDDIQPASKDCQCKTFLECIALNRLIIFIVGRNIFFK